jgi:hypothetical protein
MDALIGLELSRIVNWMFWGIEAVACKRLEYASHHQDEEEFHSTEQGVRLIAGKSLSSSLSRLL